MNLLFICIKIFFARILDVSIATIRQNILWKEKIVVGTFLAFLEVFIWFMIAREALLVPIDSIFIPISYSMGYATGTFLGSFLSKKFIRGVVGVQIVTNKDNECITKALKLRGYSMSVLTLDNEYHNESKILIFVEVKRSSYPSFEKVIHECDKHAFMIVSDTKKVWNGMVK